MRLIDVQVHETELWILAVAWQLWFGSSGVGCHAVTAGFQFQVVPMNSHDVDIAGSYSHNTIASIVTI